MTVETSFGVTIEASPYLPHGAWVALDRDRRAIAFGTSSEDFVSVPSTLRTIVCAPDLVIDLSRIKQDPCP